MSLLKITVLSLVLAIGIVYGLRYGTPQTPALVEQSAQAPTHHGHWGHTYYPTKEIPWRAE